MGQVVEQVVSKLRTANAPNDTIVSESLLQSIQVPGLACTTIRSMATNKRTRKKNAARQANAIEEGENRRDWGRHTPALPTVTLRVLEPNVSVPHVPRADC